MSNWIFPTAQEITGATKIKEADNKIQAALNDLVNWANNTGSYSPDLGASFNYTTLEAMTDVLLTSIATNDGLRWNGTKFINTPIYNRSEQDGRYVQIDGDKTINGVATFPSGIICNVTGNTSTATTLQTERNITIGNTTRSFNGSSNISWNLEDIGLGNITNESKATMFENPTFTGIPLAPTAEEGNNTLQLATTSFVKTKSEADSIGVNQTWKNVTASRAFGTTYTNDTGKPIQVSVSTSFNIYGVGGNIIINGTPIAEFQTSGGMFSFIVPNGNTYSATVNSVSLMRWSELR